MAPSVAAQKDLSSLFPSQVEKEGGNARGRVAGKGSLEWSSSKRKRSPGCSRHQLLAGHFPVPPLSIFPQVKHIDPQHAGVFGSHLPGSSVSMTSLYFFIPSMVQAPEEHSSSGRLCKAQSQVLLQFGWVQVQQGLGTPPITAAHFILPCQPFTVSLIQTVKWQAVACMQPGFQTSIDKEQS